MSITLSAIQFNHDPASADHDALNIRRNKTEYINVPEWVQGASTLPEHSVAAYSIQETKGNTITIQARFHAEDVKQAEIRAIGEPPPGDMPQPDGCTGQGCAAWIVKMIVWLMKVLFGSVLGDVSERTVSFGAGGDSGWITFDLKNVRLWSVGVGIHHTAWRWQYRLSSSDPWTDFETTRHKVYVLLALPTDPWKQSPYSSANDQLPWTEVMDYACIWAIGAKGRDTAAGKITERVFALGHSIITYDCPGGGSSNYSSPSFHCTEFLERVRGGLGLGPYVNCSDCATITSSFANILGCDLWQSRMGYEHFGLNEVIAIGATGWSLPCGDFAAFYYHEVAWKGACDVNNEVFDACLKVDGDADPTRPPHTPLQPVNIRFGNAGEGLYRDRLCTEDGRDHCNPLPDTKTRRLIT